MNTNLNEKLSRAESSRINGAKSNGPITPEGRQRSSWNRTTHGMHSTRVVLRNECMQTYMHLSERFTGLFQPRDVFEQELVSNLVNARWRIRRLEAASAANLDLAIEEGRPEFAQKYQNLDRTHEHALAYRALAQSPQSDLMSRHEDRQHRLFERSYRLLARHRGKHSALPSNEEMFRAEEGLPSDNLPPDVEELVAPALNSLEIEEDSQNQGLEPEPPPAPLQPLLIPPASPPQFAKKAEPVEERSRNIIYEDEYRLAKPMMDAFADHPALRRTLADAIREYRDRLRSAA